MEGQRIAVFIDVEGAQGLLRAQGPPTICWAVHTARECAVTLTRRSWRRSRAARANLFAPRARSQPGRVRD